MTQSKGKKVDAIHCPCIIPHWVMDLAEKEKGTESCFIMAKKLTKTDLNRQQNCLLIRSGFMDAHLIPFLSDEEKAAANFLDDGRKRKKTSSRAGERAKRSSRPGQAVEQSKNKSTERPPKTTRRRRRGGSTEGCLCRCTWELADDDPLGLLQEHRFLKGGEHSRYVAKWSGVEVAKRWELGGLDFGKERGGSPCFLLHRKESG